MRRSIVAALLLALLVLPRLAAAQAEEILYYHTDAIGSVRVVTDANGQVVTQYDYLPFGEPWQPPALQETQRFTGKEQDSETGFDYFGARYYASRNGRFVTVDPALDLEKATADPQLWNRYAYVANRPLRDVDPDGLEPLPAYLLQFYNALLRRDFSDVDIQDGVFGAIIAEGIAGPGWTVTIGDTVFLSDASAQQYHSRTQQGLALIGHELVHVVQYDILTVPGFLDSYFGHGLTNMLFKGQSKDVAYRNIPHEIKGWSIEDFLQEFFRSYPGIYDKLKNGQQLSPDELEFVRALLTPLDYPLR